MTERCFQIPGLPEVRFYGKVRELDSRDIEALKELGRAALRFLKEEEMPKGTKVHRCVEKVKAKGGGVNPYAVCQKSTGQSYKTGKKLRGKKR